MTTYTVHAVRDGRWWALSTQPEGISIHTQSRTLTQAEATAREAIALSLDVDEASVAVEVVVDSPVAV